jgi:hypothetical protein
VCKPGGLCAAAGCDADGDGAARDDAQCGGDDCDDSDARVKPGQTAFFDTPRASGGFDFDCDGVETTFVPTACGCGDVVFESDGPWGCGAHGRKHACDAFWCGPGNFIEDVTQRCR